MYKCPQCGDANSVQVLVSVWATLVQPEHDPECFETEVDGQDHEWDQNSGGNCDLCGFRAPIGDFYAGMPGNIDRCDRCEKDGVEIWETDEVGTVCVECHKAEP